MRYQGETKALTSADKNPCSRKRPELVELYSTKLIVVDQRLKEKQFPLFRPINRDQYSAETHGRFIENFTGHRKPSCNGKATHGRMFDTILAVPIEFDRDSVEGIRAR